MIQDVENWKPDGYPIPSEGGFNFSSGNDVELIDSESLSPSVVFDSAETRNRYVEIMGKRWTS